MRPAKVKVEHTITPLVVRNLKALKALVDTIEPAQEPASAAGSHLARFKLWSASLGAHRATGNRALEYRLRDASSIKNQVLSLLRDLSTVIEKAQASALEQPNDLHNDSALDEIEAYFLAGNEPLQTTLDSSLAEIGHILDCLLRLSITISNPAPHDHFQSRAGANVSGYYEPWDIKHVQDKFKDVDPIIAERLGKSITMRRHYFKYRKEHHDRLSNGLGDENDTEGDTTTIASSINERFKDTPGIVEGLDNWSEFSATSYASSSAELDQLKVPEIPKEHSEGPFLCPFCQMIVELDTRRDWKKHVYRDLQPYVCIERSCSTPMRQYARRNEWMNHMRQDHWRKWSCFFGCSGIFQAREKWHEHNRATHSQEISSISLEILEAGSIHKVPNKALGNCPLCFMENFEDSKHYSSHVGHHLRSLALFALPGIEEDNDVDREMMEERIEAMEKANKEIEEAKQAAEKATRDLIEKERQAAEERKEEEAAAMAQAQQAARDQIEAERRVEEKHKKLEAEAVARAQQAARDQIEMERKADEERRKRETEMAAAAEAVAKAKLEAAIKAKEEAEAALKRKIDEEAEMRKLLDTEAESKAEIKGREEDN